MGGDVSAQLKTQITVDDSQAEAGLSSFGDSLSGVENIVSGIIISDILVNLYNQIVDLGTAAISSSANLQNIGIAADYAFGSNSAASQMLLSLNNIAQATPFLNTQLDSLAIRMQNMGVPTQQIQGDLRDLADIASATGTSTQEMSNIMQTSGDVLATAFERGTISTLQLRSIANQGIPIYDALVKVINAQGGAYDESTKAQDKNSASLQADTQKRNDLIQKIADQQVKIKDLQDTQVKHSTNVQQTIELQNAHNLAITQAKQTLASYQDQLSKVADSLTSLNAGPSPVTKLDLTSSSKNITISAQQLQEALQSLGEGQYLGAAQAQANTYNGVLKNLQEQLMETADAILGVDQAGQVQKGGLFSQLQNAATELLNFLNSHKGDIVAFAQQLIDSFEKNIGPAFNTFLRYVNTNQGGFTNFITNLLKGIEKVGAQFINVLIPDLIQLFQWLSQNKNGIATMVQAFSDLATFIVNVNNFILTLIQTSNSLYLSASKALGAISVTNGSGTHLNYSGLLSSFSNLDQKFNLPKFASGVNNFSGGMAVVGEQGPEVVNLPAGSSVTPNGQTPGGTTVNIYNPAVHSQSDIQALIQQVKQALGRQNELARLGAI